MFKSLSLFSVIYVSYNIIFNLTIIYKELINMLGAWAKGLYDVSGGVAVC